MSSNPAPEGPVLRRSHCHLWLLAAIAFSLAYAVLRYNVLKGVEWEHFPLYIVNKATSLSAVILLASSYLVGRWIKVFEDDPEKRLVLVKFLGLGGFALAALHAVMSLTLLSPDYYPKFFAETKMNLTGEITMLFGVLGLFWMASPALSSLPNMQPALGKRLWLRSQRIGYLALSMTGIHLFAMGFKGWLTPNEWPGGMPPITMVGFAVVVLPLAAKLITKERARPAGD